MSTVLLLSIIVLLVICISLVVILLNLKTKNIDTKTKSSNNLQNNAKLVTENIQLPKKIVQMNQSSLTTASKKVFESFKSIDYTNKPAFTLDKVEWHTWQVSLLIAMIKAQKGFFVPNNDDLFHKAIIDINKNSLNNSTQKVVDKFNNNIDIYKSRDELSHDIFWSNREVSILFYYMAKH